MESEQEKWERTKMHLISKMFQSSSESSPTHEEADDAPPCLSLLRSIIMQQPPEQEESLPTPEETADDAASSVSAVQQPHLLRSIAVQHPPDQEKDDENESSPTPKGTADAPSSEPPHQVEEGDKNSSVSDDCGIYLLIIQTDPNRHDQLEEFCQELMVRIRKAYPKENLPNDCAESSHLPSSSGGTQSLRTEGLENGDPITQRDVSLSPVLSKEGGCPDSPVPHENSEQKIDTDCSSIDHCSNWETVDPRQYSSDSSERSNESSRSYCFVPKSRRARARRGLSHAREQASKRKRARSASQTSFGESKKKK